MSKMKHLLRKLHIGGGGGLTDHQHHHRPVMNPPPPSPPPPPPPPVPPQTTPFDSSSSSVVDSSLSSPSSSASSALTRATGGAVENPTANSLDFNFLEEEFQVQLALAISVSDPDGREDAETAQIKAAQQISLGRSLSETLVEFLSLRYWSYNVLNYNEKVVDGFYDVYGVTSNSMTWGKMPLLVDLETISVSDDVDYEVILVNRTADAELRQLEERVYTISMECRGLEKGLIISALVQRIADLVVDRLGGPVIDANEMVQQWTIRSYELRNSLNSIILPLGCLDVGLSRHRALLFKVLADRVNLPCMLIKESYYTGTDDGAVNLIRFDDSSEYIIDLMGAPGTLIPAEVPSVHFQTSGLDASRITTVTSTIKESSSAFNKGTGTVALSPDFGRVGSNSKAKSFNNIHSKGNDKNVMEKNQIERLEHEFSNFFQSAGRSREGSAGADLKLSSAQNTKVEDVSRCLISASKNPDFAQKLHAVLLENDASPPQDQFSDVNPHDMGQQKVLQKKINLSDEEIVVDMARFHPETLSSSNERALIPFTGMHFLDNIHYNHKQKHSAEWLAAQQQARESTVCDSAQSLPSDTPSEGFVLVGGRTIEMIRAYDAAASDILVNPYGMVTQASDGEQPHESYMFSAGKPFQEPPNNAFVDSESYLKNKINTEKDEESALKLKEMANSGQTTACTADIETINPVLGEVAAWEIRWEDLQIGERIGIGSYGEVYHAEWNGTEVAVKKFMNQDISGDMLAQFKCEVEIMLRLRHPNVVLFMGAVTRPPNLSILTEFLPRGSLFKLLHRPNIQVDEKRRMRMALDVAKGMNYLHTGHPIIVHRDLKTPNLLVDKNWVVKVCDFGMSRIKHHTFLSSKSTAGTPEWMAPEVLRNELSNEKSDVYSFGVILWELATLRIPWTGMNSMQVVGAVGFQNRHLDIPSEVDPAVAEIITDCWNLDPQARPSFGQLITRLRRLQRLSVERLETRTD